MTLMKSSQALLGRVLALSLLFTFGAFGQAVTSTIVGTVTDSTGAVIPDAQITVTNMETEAKREVRSNTRGEYTVPLLVPGRYSVAAAAPGFQSAVVRNVVLEMDATVRTDVQLEVGQITEVVTVEAQGVSLDTEGAEVAQVIVERQVKDLPLNGRNFIDLAKLSAGVTPSFGGVGTSEATSFSGGRQDLTVHIGGRGDAASFLVDGIEARAKVGGFSAVPVSVDAIREFNVKRNSFSSRYGFGEAIVSVTTKSGSNEIHGTLYEFLRNNELDARNFFEAETAPFRQNQFGAAVGGPIVKNKTFFWLFRELSG